MSKIFAISGTDDAQSAAYLAWAAIAIVTFGIFIATLRIKGGERGTS